MHQLKWTPWLIPLVFFTLIQLIVSIFAPEDYHLIKDQLSWLGEPGLSMAWVMKVGWIGFGFLILLVVAWLKQKDDLPPSILLPLMVFGIALMLMGLWDVNQSQTEMTIYHFYAFYIAQGSIILAALIHVFLVKIERLRVIHLTIGLSLLLLATLEYLIPSISGLMERIYWAVMIYWLFFYYGRMDARGNKQ